MEGPWAAGAVLMKYDLVARIDTEDPKTLQPVIEAIVARHSGTIRASGGVFEIRLTWEGESSRDLNRELLTELRHSVKKTRLRSEWTAGGMTEKFFDYVPKGTRKR